MCTLSNSPLQHLPRWGFDVELLHIAERLHIPLAEVAVNWTEVPPMFLPDGQLVIEEDVKNGPARRFYRTRAK